MRSIMMLEALMNKLDFKISHQIIFLQTFIRNILLINPIPQISKANYQGIWIRNFSDFFIWIRIYLFIFFIYFFIDIIELDFLIAFFLIHFLIFFIKILANNWIGDWITMRTMPKCEFVTRLPPSLLVFFIF